MGAASARTGRGRVRRHTFTSSSSEEDSSSEELSCGRESSQKGDQGKERGKSKRPPAREDAIRRYRLNECLPPSGLPRQEPPTRSRRCATPNEGRRNTPTGARRQGVASPKTPSDSYVTIWWGWLGDGGASSARSSLLWASKRTSFFCFLDGGSAPFFAISTVRSKPQASTRCKGARVTVCCQGALSVHPQSYPCPRASRLDHCRRPMHADTLPM